MSRILWIVGLSIALFVFSGFLLICAYTLITRGHLNPKGWAMLVCGAFTVKFIFGGLRSAIKYGDPTKDWNPKLTS